MQGAQKVARGLTLRRFPGGSGLLPFHNLSFYESGNFRTLVVILMSGPHELYAQAGWGLFQFQEIVPLHEFHARAPRWRARGSAVHFCDCVVVKNQGLVADGLVGAPNRPIQTHLVH
jgi:hypothetical protein